MAHFHYHLEVITGFKKTFVVSYKKMTFSDHKIKDDQTLRVKVNKEREVSTIAFVGAQVCSNDDKVVYCQGQLKLFSEV